eukprot:6773457-Prymnesium_polylepis.1
MASCMGGGGGKCTSCMQLAHSYTAYAPRAMSGPVPSRMSRAMPLSSASSLPAEARMETVTCCCIMMAVLPSI